MKEPEKIWRVHAASGFATEHRSMATAFEQVKVVHGWGMAADVYRWQNGEWSLYRRLEPPLPKPEDEPWPF